jgi:hypothetical protein
MSWPFELLHGVVHHVTHEAVKHVEEKNRREAESRADAEREANENRRRSLIKRIEGFIQNDIPIPQQYKWDYPDLVVETALGVRRRDLVSEMLFCYEQRKLARIAAQSAQERAQRKDRWTMRLIKLCVLLFIGFMVYMVATH